MRRWMMFVCVALAGAAAATAQPMSSNPAASDPADYAKPESWLCWPGRGDACTGDLTATVVLASGAQRVERFKPARNPTVDCFYVYPTVSLDPTPNSDMNPGAEEKRVALHHAGRFASQCRVFAPLYRQVTIPALRAALMGAPMASDRELAYADVKAAWNHYLQTENNGRGVILIGHSQGATLLRRLMREEIDAQPLQRQLVGAYLIGSNVSVADGADVGGDFSTAPLCRSSSQTGCVVAYVSFRADRPPPANSRFGLKPDAATAIACVNPAALGGGAGRLDAYLATAVQSGASAQPAWVAGKPAPQSPFVRAPGLLTGECRSEGGASYLAVSVHADPDDPRTDDIGGDLEGPAGLAAEWGLHLIDMHLAIGDLVRLAGAQAKAYHRAR